MVKDPLLDSWQRMTTKQLSLVLQSELWENPRRSRWPEVAHLLSDRGMEGEESALVGLLSGALDLPINVPELPREPLGGRPARRGRLRPPAGRVMYPRVFKRADGPHPVLVAPAPSRLRHRHPLLGAAHVQRDDHPRQRHDELRLVPPGGRHGTHRNPRPADGWS